MKKPHPYQEADKRRDKNAQQRTEEKRKLRRAQERAKGGAKKRLDKHAFEKKLKALRRHRDKLGALVKSGSYRTRGTLPQKPRDPEGKRSTSGY
jgi:hypothetical protein